MGTSPLFKVVHSVGREVLFFRIRHANRISKWLLHRFTQYLLDAACSAAAVWIACALRFEGRPPVYLWHSMAIWTGVLAVLTPIAFSLVGGYRSTWRHFNLIDLLRLVGAVTVFELVLIGLRLAGPRNGL